MTDNVSRVVRALLALSVVTTAACDKKQPPRMVSLGSTDAGVSPSRPGSLQLPPKPDGPHVRIDAAAGVVHVAVEVAKTPQERRQGLMYRTELGEHDGMVFLFERDQDHTFWMQNTLISLDMIFITADFRVAGVVHRAEPKTTTQRSVGKPSRYVLEVNGGYARAMGITEGDRVTFERVF